MPALIDPHNVHGLLSGERRGLGPSLLRMALKPASWIYAGVAAYRNYRFDRRDDLSTAMPRPIISVGNITTGGTGKTPMVEWIARNLREHGLRVALVSRGYGAEYGALNDEARELEERLPDVPHLQNPNRVAAATTAIDELDMEVVLLDDAFQHRKIRRDLDIVLIDALAPFGYGRVLPRGLLREPLGGLSRANLVILTRADLVDEATRDQLRSVVSRYAPNAAWAECSHRPTRLLNADGDERPLSHLRGKRVGAFCGIGNPEAFRRTLERQDVGEVNLRPFPDHHAFGRDDIDQLATWSAESKHDCLVCTHKDLVKIGASQIGATPLWAVLIGLEFLRGEETVIDMLRSAVASTST